MKPGMLQRRQASTFDLDPAHDPRFVSAQVRGGGDVIGALRKIACDPSVPHRAQRASLAMNYLASGRVGVDDALGAAERELERARRQPHGGGMPVPMGSPLGLMASCSSGRSCTRRSRNWGVRWLIIDVSDQDTIDNEVERLTALPQSRRPSSYGRFSRPAVGAERPTEAGSALPHDDPPPSSASGPASATWPSSSECARSLPAGR